MLSSLRFAVSALVLSVACGCSHEKKSSTEEEYTYSFDVNGCATGKHTFKDKAAYCAALLDDGLNKGCARSMRTDLHASRCK